LRREGNTARPPRHINNNTTMFHKNTTKYTTNKISLMPTITVMPTRSLTQCFTIQGIVIFLLPTSTSPSGRERESREREREESAWPHMARPWPRGR